MPDPTHDPSSDLSPVVVFDLDGTLVDTAPDLLGALNAVLVEAGLEPVPFETAKAMVGRGARVMLQRGFQARGVALDDAGLERANARFLDIYEGRIAAESRAFPGLEPALDRLAEAGFTLAVCTNKYERLSVMLLESLGLADRFRVIAGQETYGVSKPHRDHILKTVAAAGGSAADAIMVGDSPTDIAAARASEVPVVAVSFGYRDCTPEELGADRLIDHYDALFDAVAALRAPVRA